MQLPHVVVSDPSINSIMTTQVETFERLISFPEIQTPEDEDKFFQLVKEQGKKHDSGTRLVAQGYRDARRYYPQIDLTQFLDDFFTTRIATRILMDNYVEMRVPREGFHGIVCQGMRPFDMIQELVPEVTELCRSLYGCAPNVEYQGNLDCVLDYIPRHVKYMVRELLKNAFRATVERQKERGGTDLATIVIELQQGDIHVLVKISDEGGGMMKRLQRKAWKYGWSTAALAGDEDEAWQYAEESCNWDRGTTVESTDALRPVALAGYGFGLPLTRLHAQYFGGDLFMQSIPGHGTAMYLMLTHLKEGTPSTEIDDLSTVLYNRDNLKHSANAP